jgi:hypothetical protein
MYDANLGGGAGHPTSPGPLGLPLPSSESCDGWGVQRIGPFADCNGPKAWTAKSPYFWMVGGIDDRGEPTPRPRGSRRGVGGADGQHDTTRDNADYHGLS